MSMIITLGGDVYEFEGWTFELHNYAGPWPLNKNGNPRETPPGSKFYAMFDRFNKLSASQQKQCLVRNGVCIHV